MPSKNTRSNISSVSTRRVPILVSVLLASTLLTTSGTIYASNNAVTVSSSSVKTQTVNVSIDGVKQKFDQPAVLMNGSTMVPMRGVFEKLGASIDFNQKAKMVTATKGSTVIRLTIGSQVATVNGKSVTLVAKATTINGNTMVPLRFVSEALGGSATWNAATQTAVIISADGMSGGSGVAVVPPLTSGGSGSGGSGGQQVGNIRVQYGKHDYGSKTQAEYEKVMSIVHKAIDTNTVVFGGDYNAQFLKYLNGDVASNYTKGSLDYRGLLSADDRIGALVDGGVSSQTIQNIHKAATIAQSLLKDIPDPGDGAPATAADALLRGTSDCDSDSQVYNAVLDAMGFNTMIVAGNHHAEPLVKIDGNWYKVFGNSFEGASISRLFSNGGYIMAQPTSGPTF